MTFLHSEYLIFIIITIIVISYLFLRMNKRFFQWVEDYWFYKRSSLHKVSTYLYLVGVAFLLFALLDLRGPEKRITGKVSDQRTIVLIDSSASMLAEDVRPNRFSKALILVKHFVQKAVGQKISVIVFSDGQKQIIPFTDDIDLIEARIDSLKTLNLSRGGTGISLAIQESIQHFKDTSEELNGNILIFTDAEETDGGIGLEIPDEISVGVVAIGTVKGAPIPMRNNAGTFKGNKKHNNKVVITKLDENHLKELGTKIKNFNYWVATSYSLPTEKILSFFTKINKLKQSNNDFRVRPVMANYLMLPGLLFLGLSFLLGKRKVFIMLSLLMISFITFAQQPKEKKEPTKSATTLNLENRLVEGKLSEEGKKALAANLLKDGFEEDAANLYEETLEKKITSQNKAHHFNHATSMLKSKQNAKAINKYNKLLKHLENNKNDENSEIEKMTKQNILKALQSSPSSGKGEGEEDNQEQESDDKKKGEGQSDSDKQNKSKDQKDGKGDSEKDKNKDKSKDGDAKKDVKKKDNKNESGKEKKERKKKLPALLKQFIESDNQLQKKMIDAKTTNRKSRDQKDW
jgi:Ca-activated chloride channel homolog